MLTVTDIQNLLVKGEHITLECKRCENRLPSSLWDTYSAFANSYGGYIILGIEEHREEKDSTPCFIIQGVTNSSKLITDFWNLANDPNKVNVNLLTDDDVQVIELEDKQVIAIHVPRADYHLRPVYINDNPAKGTFRRNHEGDYHCVKEDIASMYRDASDEGNDGVMLRHYSMDDLDAETLRAYRQVFQVCNPGHIQKGIGKSIGKSIGKTAGKVVGAIVNNPWITIPQIAIEVQTSEVNVQKHISNLRKKGIIRRIDGKKGGHWEVVENEETE